MNEKVKAVEIKKDFDEEFTKTLKQLTETYPRVSRVKKDDKKTVNNNLESINNALLIRACRYNKRNNN